MKNLTLKKIASILNITEFKGITICGLDYFYIKDSNTICVYYNNNDFRYSYTNAKLFIADHGIESINDVKELID